MLTGDQGYVLRLFISNSSLHGQIARVLRRIHTDYADDLDVRSLARADNMGVSTFHHVLRDLAGVVIGHRVEFALSSVTGGAVLG